MTIYARNLSDKWRDAFTKYENMCGFEPMYQNEIDSGEMTPKEVWEANIYWLECLLSDVERIKTPTSDG